MTFEEAIRPDFNIPVISIYDWKRLQKEIKEKEDGSKNKNRN
jgi:hypothetical protein